MLESALPQAAQSWSLPVTAQAVPGRSLFPQMALHGDGLLHDEVNGDGMPDATVAIWDVPVVLQAQLASMFLLGQPLRWREWFVTDPEMRRVAPRQVSRPFVRVLSICLMEPR